MCNKQTVFGRDSDIIDENYNYKMDQNQEESNNHLVYNYFVL